SDQGGPSQARRRGRRAMIEDNGSQLVRSEASASSPWDERTPRRGKFVLLVCAVAACQPPKAGETLSETIRSYNDSVRWERYEIAAIHLPPTQRSARLDEWDQRAHDLKITEYDIVRVDQPTA